MSKKILAATLIMLFMIGALASIAPAKAHYTLGDLTDTYPYRSRDVDPNHVPGPTGYVFPGGGLSTYQGYLTPPSPWPTYVPGYQSPFTSIPPLQVAGTTYAPFGAILASTVKGYWTEPGKTIRGLEIDHANVGDLIFAINVTLINGETPPWERGDKTFGKLVIYIPPEFEPVDVDWTKGQTANIVTTITNDYGSIFVGKADVKDPFGPGWWVIGINGDIKFSEANGWKEWYYVRVNGIRAPTIAGRYFFKMFLDDTYPLRKAPANGIPDTVPVENYPCLLVKGEVDPAIIHGYIEYAFNHWVDALRFAPIQVPGRVRAVGIAEDPITGKPTGRPVEAIGYFNASAKGHYEIEGLAPGTYNIYASAAGFPETLVAKGVRVLRGQSLELNIDLLPGIVVSGTVYSKHGFGEEPWSSTRPITIEIYDSNEWDKLGDLAWESKHLKSFSPINLTHAPYTSYVVGNTIWTPNPGGYPISPGDYATPPTPKAVGFPWEGPGDLPDVPFVGYSGAGSEGIDPDDVHNGVGPAQYWWVDPAGTYTNGGGSNSFRFQFGVKGYYGAPTEFDGHVPQALATWVNGLEAGTYYVRVWINGYVQSDVTGTETKDYSFTVTGVEWAGDVVLPIDVYKSSWINKTVYFHHYPLAEIDGLDPGRYVIAEVFDSNGKLVGFNFTWLDNYYGMDHFTITINGLGMAGPDNAPLTARSGAVEPNVGMKYFLYRYRHLRDYGIMPGTYLVRIFMRGYVQQWSWPEATITLSNTPVEISNHVYPGASLNVTVYSIDWEKPRIERNWLYPDHWMWVGVYDSVGNMVGRIKYWDGSKWTDPKQKGGVNSIPYAGWEYGMKLKFFGSTALEERGPDFRLNFGSANIPWSGLPNSMKVMGYAPGPFLWSASIYRKYVVGLSGLDPAHLTDERVTKLGLPEDDYSVKGFTVGYVQKKEFKVHVAKSQQADIKLQLVVGANVTVNIKFKKEGQFYELPYKSSVRVRLYDEHGILRAAWIGVVPAGTKELEVKLVGFDWWYTEPSGPGISDVTPPFPYTMFYGIDGYPNYEGTWKIEVDIINLYYSDKWYPPPPGLLLGEDGPDTLYPWNHIGPWEQRTEIVVPNAHLSGEVSVVMELDLRGYLSGLVLGYTWSDEYRPTSWVSIVALSAEGKEVEKAYTFDGVYEMYLPAGSYTLSAEPWPGEAGWSWASLPVTVADGQTMDIGAGPHFLLSQSGVPIPEFPIAPVILAITLFAIVAAMYSLKRLKKPF